ncbi:hypothetical protein GGP62_003077 [Salinibacter ruber]|uniref:hypothetical protein n=1 Tax=Salinibacter ruber TaxID=146919 RepID=UPI0013C35F07|nr:hypothetical protein [Salinibacter ruber]MCS3685394.1 hypothetical protein [Salinibacter ruber]MCS3708068.1 hypothetical protein [Salinibacter ruber]MCS3856439.1 hypothetical protein [Salinibacter ruber]MCS4142199.1 hypothetical protein [Salinibacter ruber]MCS4181592.1 hypothetical protein [Salinibacter ruber]
MLFVLFSVVGCGGGKSADDYQGLIDDYEEALCVNASSNSSASATERTEALERQQEIQKELQAALEELPREEKSALRMDMSKVMAKAGDGNCP